MGVAFLFCWPLVAGQWLHDEISGAINQLILDPSYNAPCHGDTGHSNARNDGRVSSTTKHHDILGSILPCLLTALSTGRHTYEKEFDDILRTLPHQLSVGWCRFSFSKEMRRHDGPPCHSAKSCAQRFALVERSLDDRHFSANTPAASCKAHVNHTGRTTTTTLSLPPPPFSTPLDVAAAAAKPNNAPRRAPHLFDLSS